MTNRILSFSFSLFFFVLFFFPFRHTHKHCPEQYSHTNTHTHTMVNQIKLISCVCVCVCEHMAASSDAPTLCNCGQLFVVCWCQPLVDLLTLSIALDRVCRQLAPSAASQPRFAANLLALLLIWLIFTWGSAALKRSICGLILKAKVAIFVEKLIGDVKVVVVVVVVRLMEIYYITDLLKS